MQEHGIYVDHSTVLRWVLKILPVMALIFRRRKRPVGNSWRLDETMHMRKKGQLHRPSGQAVFAAGQLYSLAY